MHQIHSRAMHTKNLHMHCKNCSMLCTPNEQHTIGVISHHRCDITPTTKSVLSPPYLVGCIQVHLVDVLLLELRIHHRQVITAQNCKNSSSASFLSSKPCFPITPCHSFSSVFQTPTLALKSPNITKISLRDLI